MTREEYLIKAGYALQLDVFKDHVVPAFKVSTGFTGPKKGLKAIGGCWRKEASADDMAQIYISPVIDDSIEVLAVLIHEIIHVIVPDAGHKGPFKRIAKAVGLTGKMTATVAGPELTERLNALVERIGKYPHAKLNPALSGKKKQGTRLLKASCVDCGYTVRITRQWADLGLPACPICNLILNMED